ncbi:putative DNA binding protein [Mycobacteroides abscessus subsp. abscessus]|nr:putative DNA binding protein [Mycobacteroides abscessus subsp. abscessus]
MQEDDSTRTNRLVGRNTAEFRGQKGLSQAELATRLAAQLGKTSIDPTTITRLESGKRPTTVDELVALAQILDVDVSSLLHPGLNAARLFALQRTVAQLREHLAAMKGLLFTVDGVLVYNPELLERLSAKDREFLEGLSEYLAYDTDAET